MPRSQEPIFTLLAFIFGAIFVVVLLYFATAIPEPKPFQILVFQVVLALAAAGVAAVIPGMITLNIAPTITASGALGVFAFVCYLNPPQLLAETKTVAMRDRANLALLQGNTDFAISLYKNALELAPKDYTLLYGAGQAQYYSGNYSAAKALFIGAYNSSAEKDDDRDRRLLYNASLVYEAQGDFNNSIKNYDFIDSKFTGDASIHSNIVFSKGQNYLSLALAKTNPAQNLSLARDGFHEFIKMGGSPKQWAYYHLACIDAVLSDEESAIKNLQSAIDDIRSSRGKNTQTHYEMMTYLIKYKKFYLWMPGSPVECEPLRTLVNTRRPDIVESL